MINLTLLCVCQSERFDYSTMSGEVHVSNDSGMYFAHSVNRLIVVIASSASSYTKALR